MHKLKINVWHGALPPMVALICMFLVPVPSRGQMAPGPQENPAPAAAASTNPDYVIGAGDVLGISVTDAPEFTGKFRVNQSGDLEMVSLPTPLAAAGKTPGQVARDLTAALENAKLYRNPTVNVFVDEYHSKTVTVVGAVTKPAVYPLEKRTTVLEVISQAGGLQPTAGNKVTVLSKGTYEAGGITTGISSRTIDLAKLVRGEDATLNVEVHDGDVISVGSGEVVYVVGAVEKPGGFVMPDQESGVTALQAMALAQGLTAVANSHKALIIRRSPDGTEKETVPVDLDKLMEGKTVDVRLQANDILFIPISGTKQTLRAMGQIGMAAVNGIAIYGLGYRVGQL